MCGIAGFAGKPNSLVLKKMTASIAHRGPDDEGFFETQKISLGMRRLKIIDLTSGHQPMVSTDGRYTIVFNGEIYNYKKLKKELEEKGKTFRTNSDTEVLLEGYATWREDVFEKLDGMFGLAIWDNKEEKLVLARDRFGEKPLFYGWFDGIFIFGSEIKAILQHPAVKKELDFQALQEYLVYDYVPAPRTIFQGINQILPGSFLTVPTPGKPEKFWELSIKPQKIEEEEAATELEKNLEGAVKTRLVSDVPLGIFLSGGLDSSTIAYFAQKNTDKKVKTFSIGFEDKSFDESVYASKVAKHLGSEHFEHIFSTRDCIDVMPQIFDKLDQPFADASILPTYLLSKFTRDHVTVALDGDGSDELFGGYPTFQARKFLWLIDLIPKAVINILPTSFDNITLDYGLKRMALSRNYPKLYRDFVWIGSFAPHKLTNLLSSNVMETLRFPSGGLKTSATLGVLERYISQVPAASDFNKIVYLYIKLYLQNDILAKSDRASMMVGLESRAPFLANTLSTFINSLPNNLKLSGFKTKYLLKKVMNKYLPAEIVERKKKGFGVPMAKWLAGDLKPLLLTLLNKDKITREGIFNPEYVQQLIDDHLARRKDNRKLLWTLMAFEMWKEKWLA